jgi:H+/Cl- antiporter ClcA
MALGTGTGVVGGLGAILFRLMIGWAGDGMHALLAGVARPGWHWTLMLGPAIGLVTVSLMTRYAAREVNGHGVPQILE